MRLNRYLASGGLGSRRACERLILDGSVRVNGKVCRELATFVEPGDVVECEGRKVLPKERLVVLLHKPAGYTTSRTDQAKRRTIYDLLPKEWSHLSYAGRLDRETEGLLLLTNDGDLSNRITHPRHGLEKEYEVLLEKPFRRERKSELLRGMELPDGWAKMERVEFLTRKHAVVALKQGLKRQVRLMFAALDCPVEKLRRTRLGNLTLGNLPLGRWRVLGEAEVASLLKLTKAS